MGLLHKLKTFVTRCGAPAKFVAKTIVGIVVPGSGSVIDLIENVIDCAHETAKDNLQALASLQELERLEKMFDLTLGDLQEIVEQLRLLEDVPDLARKTLARTLALEPRCLAAAKALQEQAIQLSSMQTELKRLATGQEDLRDIYERLCGTLVDYLEEQRLYNVSPAELDGRLGRMEADIQAIKEAIQAVLGRAPDRAEAIFAELTSKQPKSAVLAVAEAASLAASHSFDRAAKTLARASRLSPGDHQLAEMARAATGHSQKATSPAPAPDGIKRPRPGDVLDGWPLERLLGHGGCGQVFLARKGDRSRALRIMHAEQSRDAEVVKRFKREMMILGSLGAHPNLVRIDPDHLFDWADDWK